MGGREVLVWTQGTAPEVSTRGNFFKEGKGIPAPLLLRRFAGHGSWRESVEQLLGLTKMDWNNDSLYDRLPVTMSYARVLARTLKRMSSLAPNPYEFRFFM
jgi:argonaute-like protein implicated in RNA metabolism and viral defense